MKTLLAILVIFTTIFLFAGGTKKLCDSTNIVTVKIDSSKIGVDSINIDSLKIIENVKL